MQTLDFPCGAILAKSLSGLTHTPKHLIRRPKPTIDG